MKDRYALVPPVHGGCQFWFITDRKLNFEVVSISVKVPGAEQFARDIFTQLTKE